MGEHTPGPWRWIPKVHERSITHELGRIVGDEDVEVCNFGNDWPINLRSGEEPSEADRALMVAAPDLLALAIKAESEARNELSRLRLQGMADGPAWANWANKQRRWAAVIAKATQQETT